ncbi:uncharacterized protein M421DRAFT_417524 [Didymella exigua CBS 183.55]|uniref:Uncharacterized protein n=1 Tax=Didymella exigua CBS 183.55 TaxID=1150837 RepID=A0A6A5RXL4_9PLEO|nr:uncharacterized protein M421DRAFT_417524 [Didymella exigua CBS 183.55]KAF1931768.1 hypothetical protein M421DRAFT_417524 [Didymella exigua CBS 183.55]
MEDFNGNDEMAAMMGFSSFGGTKKRKFDQTKSPAKEEYSASGANSTELGVRTKALENQPSVSEEVLSLAAAATTRQPPPSGGLASFLARGQALPVKPPQTASIQPEISFQANSSVSEMVSFGGPSISRADLNALRHGVQNGHGDMAYFCPSFVEDPWERLSKSHT